MYFSTLLTERISSLVHATFNGRKHEKSNRCCSMRGSTHCSRLQPLRPVFWADPGNSGGGQLGDNPTGRHNGTRWNSAGGGMVLSPLPKLKTFTHLSNPAVTLVAAFFLFYFLLFHHKQLKFLAIAKSFKTLCSYLLPTRFQKVASWS